MSSNCVWLQIIFCSCVNETTFFSFFRSFCVKMADRFAGLSESEFACLLNQKNSENTKKATKVAHNVFWEYLKEKKLTKSHSSHEKKKLTTVKTVQIHRIRKCGNPYFSQVASHWQTNTVCSTRGTTLCWMRRKIKELPFIKFALNLSISFRNRS